MERWGGPWLLCLLPLMAVGECRGSPRGPDGWCRTAGTRPAQRASRQVSRWTPALQPTRSGR